MKTILLNNLHRILVLGAYVLILPISLGQNSTFPEGTWLRSSPEDQGLDSQKLDEALKFLASKLDASETVIVRHGYLVHRGKNAGRSHGLWSCSKSFTSSVLGLLVESGKINLDDFAAKYVNVLKSKYSKVTFRHFATMTSGYDANGGAYGPKGQDGSRTPFKPAPPSFSPGSHYAYWDDAQRIFGAALSKANGKNFSSLFVDRIAKKIGMSMKWSNRDGSYGGVTVDDSAGGVSTNAENLAKYLHLFLNKGRWKSEQILSEGWIREATKVQVPATLPIHKKSQSYSGSGVYGYNWWVNGTLPDGKRMWPDAPIGTYACIGAKGNWGFVVPEWDLVFVRLGTSGNNNSSTQNEFIKKLSAAIIK